MHSQFDKESNEEAINKYRNRKEKETVICPPTCTGIIQCICNILMFKLESHTLHIVSNVDFI